MPSIPEARGVFARLPPSHYRVVARKSQHFTEREIAIEFGISRKTVSAYTERAREKLGCGSNQRLFWMYFSEYAPEMWDMPYPGIDPLG
jgi:DNA-binding NarL/FixJ family response regulator